MFERVVVYRQTLALPCLIVALLGEPASLAQPVEDLAIGRMGVEPILRQFPQPRKSAVVESQLLVAPEDRDRSRQLVERVGMRVYVLLQLRLRRRYVGHIDGAADH